MHNVNYLLASCSHRAPRFDTHYNMYGYDMLKLHLEQILKTDTSKLGQLTLIRPLPLIRNQQSNQYYNVNDLLKQFKCKTEILDVQDKWWSYSQWGNAFLKYKDQFTHYIVVEDDYYPAHNNFVEILVEQHTTILPNGGYLCGFVSDCAAVSNGIIDAKTIMYKMQIMDIMNKMVGGQRFFSTIFNPEELADYTDEYRCLFKSTNIIEESHTVLVPNKPDIINPIEFLNIPEEEKQTIETSVYPKLKGIGPRKWNPSD